MAAVPNQILNWLYNSLTNEYHYKDRAYQDIVRVLIDLPSLAPRTEVYTYETGASALLVQLQGTLPATFRGESYRCPITIWIPFQYPHEPPFCYVTSSPGTVVRPGQHVGPEGRVYHPYLAHWMNHWHTSNLRDFLTILQSLFAQEPPVMSRSATSSTDRQSQNPPQPPPKPRETHVVPPLPQSPRTVKSSTMQPPIPPKPGSYNSNSHEDRTVSLHRPPMSPTPVFFPAHQSRYSAPRSTPLNAGVMPSVPAQRGRPITHDPRPNHQNMNGHQMMGYASQQTSHAANAIMSSHYLPNPNFDQSAFHSNAPTTVNSNAHLGKSQLNPPHQNQPDLLSAPLESIQSSEILASQDTIAPPVPPNPEKDNLLRVIVVSLREQYSNLLTQQAEAVPALHAQMVALQETTRQMDSEQAQLDELDTLLKANEKILHEAMKDADRVIESVNRRKIPPADDVLVAPTVVGEQLYRLVAEERSIADAIFALSKALDKGRISYEGFVKHTRSLAREQFLRKALIRKIAEGMSLSL